jgi:hypothetical protein
MQIGADQRKRCALGPIDEFVNELDGQCDSERRSGITAITVGQTVGKGRDRSTSHGAMLTANRPSPPVVAPPRPLTA